MAQLVNNPPATHGEDALEKEVTIHSSILAWKIPWTEESTTITYYQLAEPIQGALSWRRINFIHFLHLLHFDYMLGTLSVSGVYLFLNLSLCACVFMRCNSVACPEFSKTEVGASLPQNSYSQS